jgi:DNA processing protein
MSDILYWLWLTELKNVGAVSALKYLDYFEGIEHLYSADKAEYLKVPNARPEELRMLCMKDLSRAQQVLDRCQKTGVNILCYHDADYPARLSNIYNPPLVLYYQGSFPLIDEELIIGIVGTRKASEYGLRTARRFGAEIASLGGIVTTGLAEGVDSASAAGALEAGGFVIGVLGTGVDLTYPYWNVKLQKDICDSGLILSEYPPGTGATRGSFPARNRIISGLSLGVAVVEAPIKSGALITAERAMEQGRDLFVVPGNIDLAGFQGSNALIRDGAALVTSGWDIMSQYAWRFPDKIDLNGLEKPRKLNVKRTEDQARGEPEDDVSAKKEVDKIGSMTYIDLKEQSDSLNRDEIKIAEIMGDEILHVDEIIARTQLGAAKVLSALTLRELKGYITVQDGKRFELPINLV